MMWSYALTRFPTEQLESVRSVPSRIGYSAPQLSQRSRIRR